MSRGVLFDVDGTLVDTTFLHTVAWGQSLHEGGHDIPMANILQAIGMGGDKLLDHLVPDRDRSRDEQLSEGHDTRFKQYWDELFPLPGARALLADCAARGLQVVLASSAKPEELEALQKTLDSDDAITTATSSADAESSKPDPGILQAALDQSGLSADAVVFVGDSVWDAKAARKLDITFIGLTCGGTDAEALHEAGAVEVFRDPLDLLERLDESPIGRLVGDSSY